MASNTSCHTEQENQEGKEGGGGFKWRRRQLEAVGYMRVIRLGMARRGSGHTEGIHHKTS